MDAMVEGEEAPVHKQEGPSKKLNSNSEPQDC
jgi:hypothetical protein